MERFGGQLFDGCVGDVQEERMDVMQSRLTRLLP